MTLPAICSNSSEQYTTVRWEILKLPFFVSLFLSVALLCIYEIFRRVSHTKFLYDGKNRRRLDKMRNRTPDLPYGWGLDWLLYLVDEGGGVKRCSIVKFVKSSVRNLPRHVRMFFLLPPTPDDIRSNASSPHEHLEDSVFTPIIRTTLSQEDTQALSGRETELLRLIGLDSYSFLRYLRFGFNMSFYPFLVAAVILLPIYASEPTQALSSFSSLTIQNLPTNSNKLWGATIMQLLFYTYALRLLWVEWEFFASLRLKFLARGDEHGNKKEAMAYRKTVMVENLNGLGTDALRATFLALFRDQVDAVQVVPNTSKLDALIADRLALLKKYENLVARRQYFREKKRYFVQHWDPSTGIRISKSDQALSSRHIKKPSATTKHVLEGDQCDTEKILEVYLNAIETLNREIDDEADCVKSSDENLDVAFVKFRTAAARQVSLSTRLFNGNKLSLNEAPEPNDIIWRNMYQSQIKLNVSRYIFSTILIAGVLIVIPFGFIVSAFVNVELLACFEWLNIDPQNFTSLQKSLIQGLVPPLMWLVFMSIAYFVIKLGAIHVVKFRTYTAVNAFTFRYFYLYQLLNFLVIIIGGSISSAWGKLYNNPADFWKSASAAVVNQSAFFLTYAIIRVAKNFLDLSLLLPLLRKFFLRLKRNKKGSSQRKVDKWMFPEGLNINRMLPMMSFLVLITTTYAVMIPFASFIVAISFWCSCKVYKYLTLFVNGKKFEGGGRVVFQGLQQIPVSFMVTQILWIGYLIVQEKWEASVVFSPMFIITIIVRIKINRHFVSISRVMTLAAATTIDFEELRDGTSNESDGVLDVCYTTPSLRRDKWEVEPRPYRKKNLATKRDAYANKNDLDLVEHDDKNAHLTTPDRTDLLRDRKSVV